MIFMKTWQKVLSGEKTQTRRLKRGRYQVGNTYAIQATRGGWPAGRIRMLRIWQQRLGTVSDQEAEAEGFKTVEEWLDVFCRVNACVGRIHPMDMVWGFEFELVTEQC